MAVNQSCPYKDWCRRIAELCSCKNCEYENSVFTILIDGEEVKEE